VHVWNPSPQLQGPLPSQSKSSLHGVPMVLPLLDDEMQLSPPPELVLVVPEVPDDDETGAPDVDDDDEVDVPGPSPLVVVVHAANAARRRSAPNASVDFMKGRLPC
jgi:hypothetical protein